MGVFDIALAANILGIIYLAPTCKEEYFSMLEWGLNQESHPVIIRVPGVETVSRDAVLLAEYGYPAKYEIVEQGTTVALPLWMRKCLTHCRNTVTKSLLRWRMA